jgi:hypothetical protein
MHPQLAQETREGYAKMTEARMIRKGWKYGVDESSVVSDKGDRYPYIESPEGERLWLADLDPRQSALAERLVEAVNLRNRLV